MIDRRTVLAGIGAGLVVVPRPLLAQQRPLPSVGFISFAAPVPDWSKAFATGLRENGRIPGESIRVEERYANGDPERMREQVKALLEGGTRVFVTAGSNASRMIRELSGSASVVVASLDDFEYARVQGTIARPQGQVTGFGTLHIELIPKRIELLREIIPDLRRVSIVVHLHSNANHNELAAFKEKAQALGLEVREIVVGAVAEIESGLKRAKADGVQVAFFQRGFLFEAHRAVLVAAATAASLPSVFDDAGYVRLGGFLSYAPDRADLFRRSAAYVVKLLDGAKPSDLPIQLPTKLELVVNLVTAKALGIEFPPAILVSADEVIE